MPEGPDGIDRSQPTGGRRGDRDGGAPGPDPIDPRLLHYAAEHPSLPGRHRPPRLRHRVAGGGPGLAHRPHDRGCRRPPPRAGAGPRAARRPPRGDPRAGGHGLARRADGRPGVGVGQVGPAHGAGGAGRPTRARRHRPRALRKPGRPGHQWDRRARQLLRPLPPPAVPGRHRPGHGRRRGARGRLDLGRHHRRHRPADPAVHGAGRCLDQGADGSARSGSSSAWPGTSSTWSPDSPPSRSSDGPRPRRRPSATSPSATGRPPWPRSRWPSSPRSSSSCWPPSRWPWWRWPSGSACSAAT